MPAIASWRAWTWFVLFLFVLTGCQQAVLPQGKLRSGLTQAAVVELVGRKPERTERFTLRGRPDERYTVLEFYLAQTKTSPELRYWFLFGGSGLLGYGGGDSRAARSLAYDLFYHWLADHGLMPRAEAERAYLKQLKGVYGEALNPLITEYSMLRAKIMSLVDAKKLPLGKAEAAIKEGFSDRLGASQRTAIYGGTSGPVDRYATMMRIGLVVSQASTIGRNEGANLPPLVKCEQLRAKRAGQLRCF